MQRFLLNSCIAISVQIVTANHCLAERDGPGELKIIKATQQYCVSCHGEDDFVVGDVDLSKITSDTLRTDAELTKKLLHVLDTREMPPEEEPQLGSELRKAIIAELEPVLHEAARNADDIPRAPIRRMNRFQYNNAVIDLFELRCIVFTLPERAMRIHGSYFQPASEKMPDSVAVGNRPLGKSQMIEPRLAGVAAFPQDLRAEHGYDNRGDHLSLSPLLMDEFLRLGHSITQSPDFVPKQVGIWKAFFAPPKEKANVRRVVRSRLRPFLTKAFRRPATNDLVDRYTSFAMTKMDEGTGFTEAMKLVAAATISSPRFLYLYDRVDDERTIDDHELASRLSFFLWGSLPDQGLMTLAKQGKLSNADTLVAETDRLLRDKKLKRFCDGFPSQWLQLDRIVSSIPDRERFPKFYFSKYRLSMHMMLEPLLLFETVLIEDLPITQLIDSDFTYRSAKLEQAYGELGNKNPGKSTGGGVTVLTFHRIPVEDQRSGGVITNAAVMTMTSGPERTQPITRGAWIAGVIFNDPPEPPPADVPPLSEKPDEGEENMTLRQRLSAHRQRSDCKGCHEQIDPLGFALENYGPIGGWRETYESGLSVDASGKLFREHAFSGPVEFKQAILAEKDRFARALAAHLMSYALARPLGPADEAALDTIVSAVADDGYKMKTLIKQIILSEPFRSKS